MRTEGEGGVGQNAYVVYRLSKRGCVNLRTRGGRGVKKAEKSAYVLNGSRLIPFRANEVFEVRLDKMVAKWAGSIEIGEFIVM